MYPKESMGALKLYAIFAHTFWAIGAKFSSAFQKGPLAPPTHLPTHKEVKNHSTAQSAPLILLHSSRTGPGDPYRYTVAHQAMERIHIPKKHFLRSFPEEN